MPLETQVGDGGLWAQIEARARATPDALFTVDERDRRNTFRDFRDAAERCAAGLAARGIGRESMVSWMLPTTWESMVLVAALSRLEAVQNPILPIYRHREVRFITRQAKSELLIVPTSWRGFDYLAMARDIAVERDGLDVLVVDDSLPEGDPSALPPPPPDVGDDDAPIRWLFYSSGTTAEPKGAQHTDRTLAAAGRGMVEALALREDDRVAMVFPFTHVGGIIWVFSSMRCGCSFIVVPIFDPATTPGVLAKHGVTQATAGTAFHQVYLAAQRERRASGDDSPLFPHVRTFPGGGAPKPPQLHYDMKQEMGGAGIVAGYGMTECPILAMASTHDPDDKLADTEGRACPSEVDLRVVKHDEALAAPGEEGEIRVRAPQLFRGYLDASLNAAAFDPNGYFRTGDLGRVDEEGYVSITGRLKDVIIRKGENISAKEIEDLLYTHEKVEDVAVIGLPDADTGERACAVVSLNDASRPLAMDEMVAFLKEKGLMVQKIPEQIEAIDEIPRNATGKILKQDLRKKFEHTKRGDRP